MTRRRRNLVYETAVVTFLGTLCLVGVVWIAWANIAAWVHRGETCSLWSTSAPFSVTFAGAGAGEACSDDEANTNAALTRADPGLIGHASTVCSSSLGELHWTVRAYGDDVDLATSWCLKLAQWASTQPGD